MFRLESDRTLTYSDQVSISMKQICMLLMHAEASIGKAFHKNDYFSWRLQNTKHRKPTTCTEKMIDDYDAAFASFPLLGCVLFRIIDKSKNAVQTNFENFSIYTRLRTIVKKEVCFLFYKEKRKCVMSNTFTCSKYWSCTTEKKNSKSVRWSIVCCTRAGYPPAVLI